MFICSCLTAAFFFSWESTTRLEKESVQGKRRGCSCKYVPCKKLFCPQGLPWGWAEGSAIAYRVASVAGEMSALGCFQGGGSRQSCYIFHRGQRAAGVRAYPGWLLVLWEQRLRGGLCGHLRAGSTTRNKTKGDVQQQGSIKNDLLLGRHSIRCFAGRGYSKLIGV